MAPHEEERGQVQGESREAKPLGAGLCGWKSANLGRSATERLREPKCLLCEFRATHSSVRVCSPSMQRWEAETRRVSRNLWVI